MPNAFRLFVGRCPRCGEGSLFRGIMTIRPACEVCGLNLARQDSGDGPMFFALVIMGFLAVGLAAFTEIRYRPPLWLHALVWIPFTVLGCVLVMRWFKAWLIALQYRHHPEAFQ